jgi:hypothetical protein
MIHGRGAMLRHYNDVRAPAIWTGGMKNEETILPLEQAFFKFAVEFFFHLVIY